ncbi:hypothetical protein Tco_0191166 [Tanacetum coccineum]
MSAAANTTPIVTTVTKTANKEKTQKERDKVNIQDFCEEHYEDILPIIMDKVLRDKRKERGDHTDWLREKSSRKGPREFVSMKYLWKASDSYKDLKALFCVLYAIEEDVKGPSGIKSIKRKVGETIGNSWAFKDRDKQKNGKKEAPAKEKAAAIYMIQPWHRVTRQKVTLSFAQVNEITFPPLSANKGTEGPLVIEAEIGGHAVHRMYVDGGSSMEVLYEHCFNRLRPEIKSQMVPATTSLTGFSGETIWPLGQLRLLVTIGDAEHFTKAWMNFMIVRSPSPYKNESIGDLGIMRKSKRYHSTDSWK